MKLIVNQIFYLWKLGISISKGFELIPGLFSKTSGLVNKLFRKK
jgi:hypothetical protein